MCISFAIRQYHAGILLGSRCPLLSSHSLTQHPELLQQLLRLQPYLVGTFHHLGQLARSINANSFASNILSIVLLNVFRCVAT